jgi:hypothetical protein
MRQDVCGLAAGSGELTHYRKMQPNYECRWILIGLLFLETGVAHSASSVAPSALQAKPGTSAIIVADQQSGRDLGAKIIAADNALGSAQGEIRVLRSGEISGPVLLSRQHQLVCLGDEVTLSLSTSAAYIRLQADTRVQGCTLASSQTLPPESGAEIISQGTNNVWIENVIFVGGGYHVKFATVSNFVIANTRHVSITAKGTSPILVDSSTRGQITSPRIEGFTVPAGNADIRLISLNKSTFIEIVDPTLQDVDASTVPNCGGVSFTSSHDSSLRGGVISGLRNCDGVLTESTDRDASSDIDITGTVSMNHNASPGLGKNANNGEGFDIYNSERVHLSNVTARHDGNDLSNRQSGIEVSNSREISLNHCVSSDNGIDGIRVDGSPGVKIIESQTNHNGEVGVLVMPALGRVSTTQGSPLLDWTPGDAGMTFSAVWQQGTKIVMGGRVYTISSLPSTTRMMLTSAFPARSGKYSYNVDSYVEINGGESLDNGQAFAGLPADQMVGHREGVYFAGGFSGDLTGRVTRLHAADTQDRKTQTYGIRVENRAQIVASNNSVAGNLAGRILDSPGKSSIH